MKQYTETQISIMEAFEKLLGELRFEKISVQSILNYSGISRAQFYRLFADKYDLLENTIAYQYSKFLTDDYEDTELPDKLASLFRMFDEHKAILSMKHKFDDSTLGTLLYESNIQQYCRRHEQQYGTPITEEKMWAIRFLSAGYAALIFNWLRGKTEMPLHEIFFNVKNLAPSIMVERFPLSSSQEAEKR